MNKRTVIIAGGGTGGHIYPGIAIAKALKAHDAAIDVHFVGARGGMEEKIVPREGFPLHLITVGKLHKSVGLLTQIATLARLPLALLESVRILRRVRPSAVLGVGGFASGPLLLVASLLNYRSLIWEPNAHPGMANRILARFVNECLLVFDDAGKLLKARKHEAVGVPVRANMRPQPRAPHASLRILITGGSQGARGINKVITAAITGGGSWLDGVELVHQTGRLDFADILAAYQKLPADLGTRVQAVEFLHDMESRFAWADLIVCRAGASTVAEICACRKAAIFVPLPTAADNHQQRNAEVLVRGDAAIMVLQKDFTVESFQSIVRDFKAEPERLRRLEEKVGRFQFPNSADRIVERVLAT